ncbi:hypothetical protein ISCGN_023586 [Ixodes scapularis]
MWSSPSPKPAELHDPAAGALDPDDFLPDCLPAITVTEDDLEDAMACLSPFERSGPDGLHPFLLKSSAPTLNLVLSKIFQKTFDFGIVPTMWKTSHVTPVYKGCGSDIALVDSYRPIASTSVVCRTLERIINKNVLHHLESNNLLSSAQHGFRPGRSCETALGTVVHTVSAHLDNRTPCEFIQQDLSKALDKIDHQLLMNKLHKYGIRGSLLCWLQSFIEGRTQRVVFGGEKSPPSTVLSGVPQGEPRRTSGCSLRRWTFAGSLAIREDDARSLAFPPGERSEAVGTVDSFPGWCFEASEIMGQFLVDDMTIELGCKT